METDGEEPLLKQELKGVTKVGVAVGPDACAGPTQLDIIGLYLLERRGSGGAGP